MALKGVRIPLLGQPPTTAGGENSFELFMPVQQRLFNGYLTPLGSWECRPGFEQVADTGLDCPIISIIPHAEGIAIAQNGAVFRGTGRGFKAVRQLDGGMEGHTRPNYCTHDSAVLVADSGPPQVIESHRTRRLGTQRKVVGAPTVTSLGSGDIRTGTYYYTITLTTAAGEGLPGTESSVATVSADGGKFRVELPSLDDDLRLGATAWSAYRRFDGDWGLVGTASLDKPYIDDGADDVGAAPPTYDLTESLPPHFRWITTVGDYVVGGGHDGVEWRWCREGNHDIWPEANYTSSALDDRVMMGVGIDKDLVLFKTRTIEVNALVGGTTVFARRGTIQRGCWAPDSVVMVNGTTPHWLGEDGNFYRLRGMTAEPIGILERRRVAALRRPDGMRGDLFPEEGVIRWSCEGVTWVYDYRNNTFREDAAWNGREWKPLGVFGSAMLYGKTYVGMALGRIGHWDKAYKTDDRKRIRLVRRFNVPTTKDGRMARVNALGVRMELGTADLQDTRVGDYTWTVNLSVARGDEVLITESDSQQGGVYRARKSHTSTILNGPGIYGTEWGLFWERLPLDTDPGVTVRWGFDGGSATGSHRIELTDLGDVDSYRVWGPLGYGREIWIEFERGASFPFSLSAAFIVANPQGDGGK